MVEEHIRCSQCGGHRRDGGFHLCGVGDVGLGKNGGAAGRNDARDDGFARGAVAIDDAHLGPSAAKSFEDAPPIPVAPPETSAIFPASLPAIPLSSKWMRAGSHDPARSVSIAVQMPASPTAASAAAISA